MDNVKNQEVLTDNDAVEQFKSFMAGKGFYPDVVEITGDKPHRFSTNNNSTKKNGWYYLNDLGNRLYCGTVGDWADTSRKAVWKSRSDKSFSKDDHKRFKAKMQLIKQQAEQRDKDKHDSAAVVAKKNWKKASEKVEPDFPYLKAKKIKPYGARQVRKSLLIPRFNIDGELISTQTILASGEKRFQGGAKSSNAYHIMGNLEASEKAYICEGWATGCSIHEASGVPVVVAFTASNLPACVVDFKKKYPGKNFIIAADNDLETEEKNGKNPGLEKATMCAQLYGVEITLSPVNSDFNDLHVLRGLDAVKEALELQYTPDVQMPKDFRYRDGWIYHVTFDDKFIEKEVKVCSLFEVTALSRNSENVAWGKLLEFSDADNVWHKWPMPSEMLADNGTSVREQLLHMGLEIFPSPIAHRYLNEYIAECKPSKKVRCVDKLGWVGDYYVTMDKTYGSLRPQRIVYQGAMTNNIFKQSGTLQEWQDHVGRFCPGNTRFVFAVSIAFAGPLLEMTNSESGGFHFYGSSSTGKTTLANVSSSVCGNPDEFVRQWRQTDNALESTAMHHNDNLLVLDEIGQAASKVVSETSYMLANGQGKGRANRKGVARSISQWRLIYLSTGEITIEAKIREDSWQITGGQSVRVIDIPADTGSGMKTVENLNGFKDATEFVQTLNLSIRKYYGAPLLEYIGKLTNDKGLALRSVSHHMDLFIKDNAIAGADPQVQRVCKRFALIAGAGELATEYGITGWERGEATKGAKACFNAWLDARCGTGSKEAQNGINQVIKFLQMHGSSRFDDQTNEAKVINRAGYSTYEHRDVKCYDIFQQIFIDEVCRGQNYKIVLDELKSRGLLHTRGDRGMIWRRSYPGSNRTQGNFYRIDASIIGELYQEEEEAPIEDLNLEDQLPEFSFSM